MKKSIYILFVALFFLTGTTNFLLLNHKIYAEQKSIPPYAKWGTFAMQKTKEKYPTAKIIDYLHIGRNIGNRTSTEKFKLWLKDNKKKFVVYISIEFTNDTEKIIEINSKEFSD
ncbi:DUF3889 domain-containing protein [Bacillus sp. JJ722]|uniref:DUF3889 domain-containing protein n=1 Tax=Bacillus sp. JJ722 TaxID=3122973 RepID=UPI002FFEF12E